MLLKNLHYLLVIPTSAFAASLSLLLSCEHKCSLFTQTRILHSPRCCKALERYELVGERAAGAVRARGRQVAPRGFQGGRLRFLRGARRG